MARFLGFQGQICLLDWASGNPELWGNKNGGVMFSSDSAFGKSTSKNVISLKEIFDFHATNFCAIFAFQFVYVIVLSFLKA